MEQSKSAYGERKQRAKTATTTTPRRQLQAAPPGESINITKKKNNKNSRSKSASRRRSKSRSRSRSKSPRRSPTSGRGRGRSPRSKQSALTAATSTSSLKSEPVKRVTSRRFNYDGGSDDDDENVAVVEKLDLSSNGLSVVNSSVFNNNELNELDLSTNNLRSIPSDIQHLSNLVVLEVSRNPVQGLPSELVRCRHLRVLIMSECNLTAVPPVVWKCTRLHSLDLSRNHIGPELDVGVSQLRRLRRLSLEQAGLESLPNELALCRDLETLRLWGNRIRSLPPAFGYLRRLRHLEITARSFTVDVDEYMNGLLRTGQIRSEHIPGVLYELRSLESLDLENCKVNELPDCCGELGALRQFNLGTNFLRTIPDSIVRIGSLVVLDVSGNLLSALPDALGTSLTRLEILVVSKNELDECPESLCQLENLRQLELSSNRLRQLPASIGRLARLEHLGVQNNVLSSLPPSIGDLTRLATLLLSHNRLETLPTTMRRMKSLVDAHCYRKLSRHGLWLHPNQLLTDPPETVWRTGSTARLFGYLGRQEILRASGEICRQKLFVLGGKGVDKARLIEMMTSSTTSTSAAATSIAMHRWRSRNDIEFIVYDISAASCRPITTVLPHLIDQSSLVMVVFNMATFTEDHFVGDIGVWLDLVERTADVAGVRGIVVCLVGVSDQMTSPAMASSNDEENEDAVTNDDVTKETIWRLASEYTPAGHQQEADPSMRRVRVAPDVLLVNYSSDVDDIRRQHWLSDQVELIVTDRQLFNQRNRVTDDILAVGKSLRKHSAQTDHQLFVDIDDFFTSSAVIERSPDTGDDPAADFQHAVDVLSEIGHVIRMPGTVFTRPRDLVDIVGRCFRRREGSEDDDDDDGGGGGGGREKIYYDTLSLTQRHQSKTLTYCEAVAHFHETGIASMQLLHSWLFDLKISSRQLACIVDALRRLGVVDDVTSGRDDDDSSSCQPEVVFFPAYAR